jgi:hypothetical protein
MEASLSIIIATSGRVEKIRCLLDSLCRVQGRDHIKHEIVIANNATHELTAAAVEALAREFDGKDGVRCWQVREPVAGSAGPKTKPFAKRKGTSWLFSTTTSKSRRNGWKRLTLFQETSS